MKLRWIIPLAILLPLRLNASDPIVAAKVTTIIINPNEITALHLKPEFVSTIRLPEEVSSVVLGSLGSFKAEHSAAEPEYVYVKPTTTEPAQSDLEITLKSGQHVTLELISEGASSETGAQPVDFLLEYRTSRGFLVGLDTTRSHGHDAPSAPVEVGTNRIPAGFVGAASSSYSGLELEYQQQVHLNSPTWTKWEGKQIETSLGDIRQWGNETVISYSVFNPGDHAVEIVPPQIQIAGRKIEKKKKKQGKEIISDQLQIREFKLSTTRLEAGARADGVVVFDRPNFKESSENLFLQIAQADQIDKPILVHLPFTPPISAAR